MKTVNAEMEFKLREMNISISGITIPAYAIEYTVE